MEQQLGEVLRQLASALQGGDRRELENLVKSLYGDIEGALEDKDRQTLQKLMEALKTGQVGGER